MADYDYEQITPQQVEEERDNRAALLALLLLLGLLGRYRNVATGRLLPQNTARRELDRYLTGAGEPVKALAAQLQAGQIDIATWLIQMQAIVKTTNLTAVAFSAGGWGNMTAANYATATRLTAEQFRYLSKFAENIVSGKQKLDGTLARRAEMYMQAARKSYYDSRHEQLTALNIPGRAVVKSVLNPADHCEDCVRLDGRWHYLDTGEAVSGGGRYIAIGSRICKTNCKCGEVTAMMIDGQIVAEQEV